jgi:hypothetical protein
MPEYDFSKGKRGAVLPAPSRKDVQREAVEATLKLVRARLDELIINLRHAGSPLADNIIRWRGLKFPSTEEVMNIVAPQYDLSAGLVPKEEAPE